MVYQYNVQVDSAKSLSWRRSGSRFFCSQMQKAQKLEDFGLLWVWQCRVVDIELRYAMRSTSLKARVSYITSDVKKFVKEFR